PPAKTEEQCGIEGGEEVIEHSSEAAAESVIQVPYRPGLPDVEQPEEQVAGDPEHERNRKCYQNQVHGDDLVPHDSRMVVNGEALASLTAQPYPRGEEHGREYELQVELQPKGTPRERDPEQ